MMILEFFFWQMQIFTILILPFVFLYELVLGRSYRARYRFSHDLGTESCVPYEFVELHYNAIHSDRCDGV